MSVLIYIRFVLGVICILASLIFFIIEVMGVFKMTYVLNRMHSAAIGDAIALGLAFVGLMLLNGANFTTCKLFMVPCFMFFSSPVASHLIARMEVETTKSKGKFKNVNVRDLDNISDEEGK